ncbi:putative quorum-sensing-regulated virulence factor [Vibrio agarivorans]|uniref:putative quorum-sensing-regulated virulence factor n=1 Tax=Vibrio agarivorans TaxID=153622 RepID=UPI003F512527
MYCQYLIIPRKVVIYCFDKKGWPSGELGDLLKLCLALKIEGLDSVVKPLKRM